MLLLGVVQAQVSGAESFGSYDLLQTEILTGSQASVTFSSLGDYASDYQHLQLRVAARSDRVDNVDFLQVTFNSDSAANYSLHYLRGSGSGSPSSLGLANQSHIWAGFLGTANHTADIFAPAVIDILDPFETSKYTTLRALGGVNSVEPNIALFSGSWRNTNALTDITLDQFGSNFVIGSRFSLYGLRK